MSQYAQRLYETFAPMLKIHRATYSDRRLGRGILTSSNRGFMLHFETESSPDPILIYGMMNDKGRMYVTDPLLSIRSNGDFCIHRADPATQYAYIWDDPMMFLSKFYHGRRAFLVPRQPYTNMEVRGTWMYGKRNLTGPYRQEPPPLVFQNMYLARSFINHSSLRPGDIWLNFDESNGPPRIVIVDKGNALDAAAHLQEFLDLSERYSDKAFRRLAKSVKRNGGTVHYPPTRIGDKMPDATALPRFTKHVDIYPTRPSEATQ